MFIRECYVQVHSMLEVVQGTTYIKEKEKEKRKERKKAAATHGPTKLSKREILLKKRKEELGT